MIPTRACGTMRTVRTPSASTRITMTMIAMTPGPIFLSSRAVSHRDTGALSWSAVATPLTAARGQLRQHPRRDVTAGFGPRFMDLQLAIPVHARAPETHKKPAHAITVVAGFT